MIGSLRAVFHTLREKIPLQEKTEKTAGVSGASCKSTL